MSLLARRREAEQAERRLLLAQAGWLERTQALRRRFDAHRGACVLGGGFASGFVAGLLPLRGIARLGGVAVGVVTTALRAPLAAMLVESLRRRTPGGEDPG